MEYLEFDLKVGAGEGRQYPVSVLRSPAGEASATMTFPYDELVLDNRLQAVQIALLQGSGQRRRVRSSAETQVQSFGGDIFDALITGPVRELYDASRQEAGRARKGLRVRLRFDAPELAALPWEFAYDKRDDEYVCLSRATPLVRYIELAQPQEPLEVALPLRVLVMIVGPTDLGSLDTERERARIAEALAPLERAGRVELHWLEGQTWRHLQQAMLGGPWHVFHFVGHGGFDRQRGEGTIAVADDSGAAHQLGATELGRLLGDHESLRMAVLNACEGATADRTDVFSSTAGMLVRRGTPAVIAMQYEISDQAAVELARSFYAAVATGVPVDVSLTEARKAVAMAAPGTLEWATPVLYLRAPEGRLFDIPDQPATHVTPAPTPRPAPEPEPDRAWVPAPAPSEPAPDLEAVEPPAWRDASPGPRDRRRSTMGRIVLAVLVLAVLLTLGLVLAALLVDEDEPSAFRDGDEGRGVESGIELPDVIGLPVTDAGRALEDAGFIVEGPFFECSFQVADGEADSIVLFDTGDVVASASGGIEDEGPFEESTRVVLIGANSGLC